MGYLYPGVILSIKQEKNKVWDFQIVAMIETGLTDAGISKETIDEIISRAKLYIMKTLETQS